MPVPLTADQALIRKMNTAVILDTLRRFVPLSRADLAARTGLNRSTISLIVNSLIEEGYIQETDRQSAKIGRPGTQLVLNPNGGFAIGVEIGVDFISALLTDFVANSLWHSRVASDPAQDQVAIIDQATSMIQTAYDHGIGIGLRPLGIELGEPGLVDLRQGKLIFAPNLGWENVPLRLMFSQRFNLPVFIENEANAAALGEYYFGAAQGVANLVYLSAGIGLGGGILIDGKLFRGSSCYASEVGHMTTDPDGELCSCGKRGCWETQVGPRSVLRRVRRTLAQGTPSQLNDLVERHIEEITFEHVVQAAHQQDIVARRALEDIGDALGLGVANLVNIFNPQLIVLGGALNLASQFLLLKIEDVVSHSALSPACENLRIIASAHGADACVMGAIALVLDDILREPIS